MSDGEPAGALGAVAAAAGAMLGGAGIWSFLSERMKSRRSPPAQMIAAEGEFAEAAAEFSKRFGEAAAGLVDHLRRELNFVRGQVEELRDKVNGCEARHQECEATVAEIRRENEQSRARLQAEIDRLLRDNPPAGY